MSTAKKKVTGVGGIFFKCADPKKMKDWYGQHLGFPITEYGCKFEFRHADNPEKVGSLAWSPFKDDTKYFEPSQKDFMVNYRVENIEELVEELKKAGVTVCDKIESFDKFGKFVHILDPENNKIQLWEPA